MFVCEKCHEADKKAGCPGHFSGSYGPCEGCGKVSRCVDCKYYKGNINQYKEK